MMCDGTCPICRNYSLCYGERGDFGYPIQPDWCNICGYETQSPFLADIFTEDQIRKLWELQIAPYEHLETNDE